MKSNELLQLLNDNKGAHLYSIYIPSLKKEYNFKPISVGQQLTLSKLAIQSPDQFYKAITILIQQLCTEELDLNILNEIDRIIILIKIKKNNITKQNLFSITCPYCKEQFTQPIDYENYIIGYESLDISDSIINVNIYDINYTIRVGFPSINTILKRKERNEEELPDDDIIYNLFNFIREITINNNKLEDLEEMPDKDKIVLYNELPGEILEELMEVILNKYDFILNKFMKHDIECEHCQKKITDILDIKNFFFLK